MTQTDRGTILELTEKLNRDATSTPFIYLGLAGGAGALLGLVLGGNTAGLRLICAVGYAIVGGLVGRSLGQSRAASLRLQALTALRLLDAQ